MAIGITSRAFELPSIPNSLANRQGFSREKRNIFLSPECLSLKKEEKAKSNDRTTLISRDRDVKREKRKEASIYYLLSAYQTRPNKFLFMLEEEKEIVSSLASASFSLSYCFYDC